ncbi:MAG: HEPN domain-containing protein [Actinobacteria bacterium]|nr:HEPN domain-containing protein [Actinomycetota bacterium]
MREEATWWLRASDRDKQAAEKLLNWDLFESSAFHAQQSAEKALKALLIRYGREARTHSCVSILKLLKMEGLDVSSVELSAKRLDSHYIQSRYPNGAGGPPEDLYSKEIAEEAMECLGRILSLVHQNI